jgi:aryl-alcohol dehydrogenase-like predicted oxidoreductase
MIARRRLGSLEVSAQGLGCFGMTGTYGAPDGTEARATLDMALELGVTFLDTADMYGYGANEELIGEVIRARRDDVQIATKFGVLRGPQDSGPGRVDGRPEHVREACEGSLRRLGVEVIDLYYQHRVDVSVPIEETIGAVADLVAAGKVRHIGLSEASPDQIRRAAATHPISALQSEWSLWCREIEDEVIPACRDLGIGIVPFSPLGRGFLTGQIKSPNDFDADDLRRGLPRFQGDNFYKNLELVDEVHRLADAKGCTPGQLALAWLQAQGDDVVPIPGTKRRSYLAENVEALEVELTHEELDAIDVIAPKEAAVGDRYEDMSWVKN